MTAPKQSAASESAAEYAGWNEVPVSRRKAQAPTLFCHSYCSPLADGCR
jgi:hypothetical protein